MTCNFFFSSRRRHTRLQGDWSSDVCSSDLHCPERRELRFPFGKLRLQARKKSRAVGLIACGVGRIEPRQHFEDRGGDRSEGRRVGEEGRYRWEPDTLKKKRR